jgi:hypothetical protein
VKTIPNAPPLDHRLMKGMVHCVGEMPKEQRKDITGRALGLIRFLEQHAPDQDMKARATALVSFEFRMRALALLRERPEYKAWALRTSKSGQPDLVKEVLIETAASAPLVESNKRPAFDAVAFFQLALERAEAEGCA